MNVNEEEEASLSTNENERCSDEERQGEPKKTKCKEATVGTKEEEHNKRKRRYIRAVENDKTQIYV